MPDEPEDHVVLIEVQLGDAEVRTVDVFDGPSDGHDVHEWKPYPYAGPDLAELVREAKTFVSNQVIYAADHNAWRITVDGVLAYSSDSSNPGRVVDGYDPTGEST